MVTIEKEDTSNTVKANPIFSYALDKIQENPLYTQLILIIKQCIHSGQLGTGDALPPESELCEFFDVSRSTVRQALSGLEKEGLVYRRRGLGTFVANPKLKKNVSTLYSFTAQTKMVGMVPSSTVLKFSIIEADSDLKQLFQTAVFQFKVYEIYRIRKADGIPLILERTYIPYTICPVLTAKRLENESLYSILHSECSVVPHHGLESYEVIQIEKPDAELLECPVGTLAFSVERVAALENGEVYEITRSVVRGDRCKFEVPLFNEIAKPYRQFK